MNPLGKFQARPSLVLSIRQRRRFYAECRQEMQEKVGSWDNIETGPVSGVKSSFNNFRKDTFNNLYILNVILNIFVIFNDYIIFKKYLKDCVLYLNKYILGIR